MSIDNQKSLIAKKSKLKKAKILTLYDLYNIKQFSFKFSFQNYIDEIPLKSETFK